MSTMKMRNLEFQVSEAIITGKLIRYNLLECDLDFEFKPLEVNYDDLDYSDQWEPRLYHQGLVFRANSWADLQGKTAQYTSPDDINYNHPEIGCMYVFHHAVTKNNFIEFGNLTDGIIDFKWRGTVDLSEGSPYDGDIPFELKYKLKIPNWEAGLKVPPP